MIHFSVHKVISHNKPLHWVTTNETDEKKEETCIGGALDK